jgi:hypothetical protein
MNKRKKVAWHKHLVAAKKHNEKAKALRPAGTSPTPTPKRATA